MPRAGADVEEAGPGEQQAPEQPHGRQDQKASPGQAHHGFRCARRERRVRLAQQAGHEHEAADQIAGAADQQHDRAAQMLVVERGEAPDAGAMGVA